MRRTPGGTAPMPMHRESWLARIRSGATEGRQRSGTGGHEWTGRW